MTSQRASAPRDSERNILTLTPIFVELETEDFAWVTRKLCDAADALCAGRVVSTLEGGYDLNALAESASAHVQVLMSRS